MNEQQITEAICAASEATAEQLLAEGRKSAKYGATRRDLDGLAKDLGRKPTKDEVERFEEAARDRLRTALAEPPEHDVCPVAMGVS